MLEEVIVTARKRQEMLQDVPVAVTAFSNQYLENNEITIFEDLRNHVPSMGITTGGTSPNNPIISLRGQRPNDMLITQDAAVPIYFADVVLTPTHGTNQSLYDLANVQILKGPQGTLFGRNSTGGALLFTPQTPDDILGGYAEVTVGNYNALGLEGAVDIPVTDNLALRLAGKTYERDGYQSNLAENILRSDDEFWDEDSNAARLSLMWTATDSIENLLVVDWNENEMKSRVPTPIAYLPEGYGCRLCPVTNALFNSQGAIDEAIDRQSGRDWNEIETDVRATDHVKNLLASNVTTWEVSDNLSMKNVLGYRDMEFKSSNGDVDGTALPIFGAITDGDFINPDVVTLNPPMGLVSGEQVSNELQLLGESFNSHLDWIIGAYFFQMEGLTETASQSTPLALRGASDGDVTNTAYALFAEGTWSFNNTWALTVGARQSWDEREVTWKNQSLNRDGSADSCLLKNPDNPSESMPDDNCAVPSEETYDHPTWRIIGSWTPDVDALLYGSVSTGYRTGGFNLRAIQVIEYAPYEEETVMTYEVGYKSDWRLGSTSVMRTNMAIYFQDYQDIQITQAVAASDGGFGTVIVNAGEAEIWGAELELWLMPISGLDLGVSYAYTNTDYTKRDGINQNTGLVEDLSDRDFLFIPENTLSATVRYELPLDEGVGTISLGAHYYWQDESRGFADLDEFDIGGGINEDRLNDSIWNDSYGVWDARIDWNGVMQSGFNVSAWVKNGSDEAYVTGGLNVPTTLGWLAQTYGPPRTYGVSLRYSF